MKAAVYDFDGTIIPGDSVEDLLLFAYNKEIISASYLIKAAIKAIGFKSHLIGEECAKTAGHAFLKEIPVKEREGLMKEFAAHIVKKARPEALKTIRDYQGKGVKVILCSASCECYMKYVADMLGTDLLCSASDENGMYRPPNCKGDEKVNRLRVWLIDNSMTQHDLVCGYGDSVSDAPMLRFCQDAVLVNAKKALKKEMPKTKSVKWRENK